MAANPQPQVTVERRMLGTTTQLAVEGELDLASCPELRRQTEAALRGGPERVVIDLRDVTFIDSTGINALLRLRTRAIAQCVQLVVMRPAAPGADRVFEICGLQGVFPNLDGAAQR